MIAGALQVVITIWLGVHPFTFTLPKLYPTTEATCELQLEQLLKHRKHKRQHMELECAPTDKVAL